MSLLQVGIAGVLIYVLWSSRQQPVPANAAVPAAPSGLSSILDRFLGKPGTSPVNIATPPFVGSVAVTPADQISAHGLGVQIVPPRPVSSMVITYPVYAPRGGRYSVL